MFVVLKHMILITKLFFFQNDMSVYLWAERFPIHPTKEASVTALQIQLDAWSLKKLVCHAVHMVKRAGNAQHRQAAMRILCCIEFEIVYKCREFCF